VAAVINIHNGDMMLNAARRAVLPGEHMAFREALAVGPIPTAEQWTATRSRFLSERYGQDLLRTSHELFEQQQALDAASSADEVVLWFEHDLFCLVNLLYLLNRLSRSVSLVWCPDPLALADDATLHKLFDSRYPVTPTLREAAARAWRAYASDDPRGLTNAAASDFPFLREGLMLHASRFPSARNGLGSVENRLLALIAGGATEFGPLFEGFDPAPPRFGYGDSEVLATLRDLARRDVPLITLNEVSQTPAKAIAALTPAGENVLADKVDDVEVNLPDRWLGGVHLTRERMFRWDEAKQVLLSP
jgi:hypothetical protein